MRCSFLLILTLLLVACAPKESLVGPVIEEHPIESLVHETTALHTYEMRLEKHVQTSSYGGKQILYILRPEELMIHQGESIQFTLSEPLKETLRVIRVKEEQGKKVFSELQSVVLTQFEQAPVISFPDVGEYKILCLRHSCIGRVIVS